MRTPEEIEHEVEYFDARKEPGSNNIWLEAVIDGLTRGAELITEGKTNQEIYEFSKSDYQSYGDDDEDEWQSGFETGVLWCAERFDWNHEGVAVWREDIWGAAPEGWHGTRIVIDDGDDPLH